MKPNALLLKPSDNVVTCISPVKKGEPVVYRRGDELCSFPALEDIPYCHKAAIQNIAVGEEIIKYAQSIGVALTNLPTGSWVSHLNIRGVPRDYDSELI